jgi:hypothetical protein
MHGNPSFLLSLLVRDMRKGERVRKLASQRVDFSLLQVHDLNHHNHTFLSGTHAR